MSNILTIFVDNDTQLSIFKDSEDIWGLKWLKKTFLSKPFGFWRNGNFLNSSKRRFVPR